MQKIFAFVRQDIVLTSDRHYFAPEKGIDKTRGGHIALPDNINQRVFSACLAPRTEKVRPAVA